MKDSILVNELTADLVFGGQEFLVSSLSTGTTKTGKPYANVKLSDKTGVVSGKLWDFGSQPSHSLVKDGAIIRIDGKTELYKDQLQVTIQSVGPAINNDASRFEKVSEYNPSEMWDLFFGYATTFKNQVVQKVATDIVDKYKDAFLTKPAATGMHHAFKHGLLEHTLQMLQTADKLFELPFYKKSLNEDLCMFGIMFHDFGKIFEYGDGPSYKKTVSGIKVPHIPKMGAIIYHVCQQHGVEDAVCDELMSVVLSHHKFMQWGSPVMPSSPEALFVHYVDNLHGDVFGSLQKLAEDNSSDLTVKYGYGADALTLVKKRFKDVIKETYDGTGNEENVRATGVGEGSEVDMGGF